MRRPQSTVTERALAPRRSDQRWQAGPRGLGHKATHRRCGPLAASHRMPALTTAPGNGIRAIKPGLPANTSLPAGVREAIGPPAIASPPPQSVTVQARPSNVVGRDPLARRAQALIRRRCRRRARRSKTVSPAGAGRFPRAGAGTHPRTNRPPPAARHFHVPVARQPHPPPNNHTVGNAPRWRKGGRRPQASRRRRPRTGSLGGGKATSTIRLSAGPASIDRIRARARSANLDETRSRHWRGLSRRSLRSRSRTGPA